MNYVALEQSVGAFLVAEPSFSPYSSFLFTTQFIFTIFSVLIIITAIFKISRVGAKQYVLQVYGQYNGKTMSTKEVGRDLQKNRMVRRAVLFLLGLWG